MRDTFKPVSSSTTEYPLSRASLRMASFRQARTKSPCDRRLTPTRQRDPKDPAFCKREISRPNLSYTVPIAAPLALKRRTNAETRRRALLLSEQLTNNPSKTFLMTSQRSSTVPEERSVWSLTMAVARFPTTTRSCPHRRQGGIDICNTRSLTLQYLQCNRSTSSRFCRNWNISTMCNVVIRRSGGG